MTHNVICQSCISRLENEEKSWTNSDFDESNLDCGTVCTQKDNVF